MNERSRENHFAGVKTGFFCSQRICNTFRATDVCWLCFEFISAQTNTPVERARVKQRTECGDAPSKFQTQVANQASLVLLTTFRCASFFSGLHLSGVNTTEIATTVLKTPKENNIVTIKMLVVCNSRFTPPTAQHVVVCLPKRSETRQANIADHLAGGLFHTVILQTENQQKVHFILATLTNPSTSLIAGVLKLQTVSPDFLLFHTCKPRRFHTPNRLCHMTGQNLTVCRFNWLQ